MGGVGFILVGVVIVLVVLYAVFGGAAVPLEQDPSSVVAPAAVETPLADPAPTPVPSE
jgi:hypothetical protein